MLQLSGPMQVANHTPLVTLLSFKMMNATKKLTKLIDNAIVPCRFLKQKLWSSSIITEERRIF